MTIKIGRILAAVAAIGLSATSAQAHRQWMLPSATSLSGDDVWVTVDAAVSNDLFYFEHVPMRTDNIKAWFPDGTETKIENASTGKYRSTFDVHLTQKGTYKIANVTNGVMGSYKLNGTETRLPRGTTKEQLATVIPAGATDVQVSEMSGRNEIFVTVGEPTEGVLKPTGVGLEMQPITHPTDLVAGEDARFRFLADGKPAANLEIEVVPGGVRYRDQLGDRKVTTDANGEVSISWPEPGMYWLSASIGGGRGGPGAAPAAAPAKRMSYVTTLEVQAP
jgi:uncharacterized GH25 family protein